jgi:hypothetical protein
VYTPEPDQKNRPKDNYAVSKFIMEIIGPKSGEPCFKSLWDQVEPDFLSGTTNKTRFYTGDSCYYEKWKIGKRFRTPPLKI